MTEVLFSFYLSMCLSSDFLHANCIKCLLVTILLSFVIYGLRYELIKINQFRGLSLSIVKLFSKQVFIFL